MPLKILTEKQLSTFLSFFVQTDLVQGCSVSMPFKNITFNSFSDQASLSAKEYQSVNTLIKRPDRSLSAETTDPLIFEAFHTRIHGQVETVIIYGSGSMACMAVSFFRKLDLPTLSFDRHSLSRLHLYLSTLTKPVAFINATPADLFSLGITPSSRFHVLDMPIRFDQDIYYHPYIFSGVASTCYQFQAQFQEYTSINIPLSDIKSVLNHLFMK